MSKSIGDRMKEYEAVTTAATLTRRVPAILRLDGRGFHTFSSRLESPYDEVFHQCMTKVAIDLCRAVQGSQFAYHFSDEISILVTDYQSIDTDAYFAYSLQKVLSITASACTSFFASSCMERMPGWFPPFPMFDCRAFSMPKEDVPNYFLWRQQDCTRNSIQTIARCHYSHKQLLNVNTSKMQDMLMEKGVNWNDFPTRIKRGIGIFKWSGGKVSVTEGPRDRWVADYEMPILTADWGYVHRWTEDTVALEEGVDPSRFRSVTDLGFKEKRRDDVKADEHNPEDPEQTITT